MNDSILINANTCKECGLCAEVCPNKIIKKTGNDISVREDRLHLCFKCGQCMAICPTRSVMISGFSYENDFFPLPECKSAEEQFYSLIYTRRAIRNFEKKPVPRELLEKIINAISFSPPGFPPNKVEIVVISDPEIIKKALPLMINFYDFLVKNFNNPFARMKIRKEVGKQRFETMHRHLIPLMKSRLPELKNGTENTITRDAQAMILFLADKNSEDISTDIHIAATYGLLATHALGLGGSIMDIIPPAVERNKDLRKLLSVEKNQQVIASLILGYPQYKYQRGISRQLKKVKWL